MKEIIIACILFLISGDVFVMSILSFMQKGFLLNNAYIYASKEERKELDKKSHYRHSAIVFLFLGVAFLLLGIMMLTKAYWLLYIAIGMAILTTIYAVVSGIKIENQEDKKKANRTMKKENIYKFLYIAAALLVAGFAIAFGVDVYRYNAGGYLGSSPLYVYALVDAVEYLLPSSAFFIAGLICKKKFAKR